MMNDLVPGDLIFINDGIIRLFVKEVEKEKNCLLCEVEAGM
jgi:pyruvate kinase